MPVTAFHAALLTILGCYLIVRVIRARRCARVALGDGGDIAVIRAARAHGNFIETVPFALILMALAESLAAPGWLLHALGAALLTGRSLHAFGVSRDPEDFRFRVAGMAVTFAVLGISALTCLILSLDGAW
jgi:uncharacterized membrane protein YecN with MAPEG domain